MLLHRLSGKTSHLLFDGFFKQSMHLTRNVGSSGKMSGALTKVRSGALIAKDHHKVVYEFPAVKFLGAYLRSKVWLPPVGFVVSVVLFSFDETRMYSVLCALTACIAGSTGAMLSKFAENVVGKVYVNKEGEIKDILVSSISKSGKRTDRIHCINDIVNNDFPNKAYRQLGFITFAIENSDLVYKLNVRNCTLIDRGICGHLFGQIWNNKEEVGNYIKEGKQTEENFIFKIRKVFKNL